MIHDIPGIHADDTLFIERAGTGSVRVQYAHTDDFSADEDQILTLGEYRVQDLIRALLPPLPATQHVAKEVPKPFKRRPWRRK